MNRKFFAFVLTAVGLILLSSLFIPKLTDFQSRETATTSQPESENAQLIIVYSENNVSTYTQEVDDNATAFSLLKSAADKNNLSLETQQYDFGVFVKSLNGKESGTEAAWIYFVNGTSGQVAADQQKINSGDTLEWKYIKPE